MVRGDQSMFSSSKPAWILTWPELLSGRVNLDLRLGRHGQFLADLLGRDLGDLEHLNERLVLDEGALCRGESVEQVVLELLHLALVGRHLLQELGPLSLQLLQETVQGELR